MIVMVMDGQGGGIGAAIIKGLRNAISHEMEILALSTNSIATSRMMKAGANKGATGETRDMRIMKLSADTGDILWEQFFDLGAYDDAFDLKPIAGGGYLVDARLSVDDLSELVETALPDEDWDTVGGLLLGLAGRVPQEGEAFEVEHLVLTAVRVQGRRISQIRVIPR